MADLIAHRVFYVHESEEEVLGDSFKFTATDGTHNVSQYLSLYLVHTSLVVTLNNIILLH